LIRTPIGAAYENGLAFDVEGKGNSNPVIKAQIYYYIFSLKAK